MAEDLKMETAIDTALARLAQEVNDNTPRPGADLMARVLADAAAVAPAMAAPSVRTEAARPRGFLDRVFGWTSGAIAAVAVCFSVGVAVGMEMDSNTLPVSAIQEQNVMGEVDGLFGPEDGVL